MIKCVLFDLDGVLVEARDWHYHAFNKALKNIANTEISLQEHLETFNGLPTAKKLKMLISMDRIKEDDFDKIWKYKQHYTIETIKEMGSVDNEKVKLMSFLKSSGIKIACVTNSIRETAELMLTVTGQIDYIDLLISNEDVEKPKPSPEGYKKAMSIFKTLPQEAIVVEDSEYGIKAAQDSGAYIMKVNCAADVSQKAVEKYLEKYGF